MGKPAHTTAATQSAGLRAPGLTSRILPPPSQPEVAEGEGDDADFWGQEGAVDFYFFLRFFTG
jgi:hypothetical protein